MPDQRRHRGAHPRDRELFAESRRAALAQAVADFSWLSSRDYSALAALKLVGDHYQLTARQRDAVTRASCSDVALARRRARRVGVAELAGQAVAVDGFNAVITLEVALSGGLGLIGRDGARRDLASVHGTYRRVIETQQALLLLVEQLGACAPAHVAWYLDRPVSNSGKLAALLRELLAQSQPTWTVELLNDVDHRISLPGAIALSADSVILDAAERWFDLAGWVVRERVPEAWTLDFSAPDAT